MFLVRLAGKAGDCRHGLRSRQDRGGCWNRHIPLLVLRSGEAGAVAILHGLFHPRGGLDGGTNPSVGAAAANVAIHCAVDLSIRGLGSFLEQSGGLHDLAALARRIWRRSAKRGGQEPVYLKATKEPLKD